jgi:CrcB protein
MQLYFWIWVGSGFGGMLRYGLSTAITLAQPGPFPWGTVIVNITGSFLIGLFAGLSISESRFAISPTTRQFLMTGICGGYTTFSSFSLQTLTLIQDGELLKAAGNVGVSVALCLVATWLGHLAGLALSTART